MDTAPSALHHSPSRPRYTDTLNPCADDDPAAAALDLGRHEEEHRAAVCRAEVMARTGLLAAEHEAAMQAIVAQRRREDRHMARVALDREAAGALHCAFDAAVADHQRMTTALAFAVDLERLISSEAEQRVRIGCQLALAADDLITRATAACAQAVVRDRARAEEDARNALVLMARRDRAAIARAGCESAEVAARTALVSAERAADSSLRLAAAAEWRTLQRATMDRAEDARSVVAEAIGVLAAVASEAKARRRRMVEERVARMALSVTQRVLEVEYQRRIALWDAELAAREALCGERASGTVMHLSHEAAGRTLDEERAYVLGAAREDAARAVEAATVALAGLETATRAALEAEAFAQALAWRALCRTVGILHGALHMAVDEEVAARHRICDEERRGLQSLRSGALLVEEEAQRRVVACAEALSTLCSSELHARLGITTTGHTHWVQVACESLVCLEAQAREQVVRNAHDALAAAVTVFHSCKAATDASMEVQSLLEAEAARRMELQWESTIAVAACSASQRFAALVAAEESQWRWIADAFRRGREAVAAAANLAARADLCVARSVVADDSVRLWQALEGQRRVAMELEEETLRERDAAVVRVWFTETQQRDRRREHEAAGMRCMHRLCVESEETVVRGAFADAVRAEFHELRHAALLSAEAGERCAVVGTALRARAVLLSECSVAALHRGETSRRQELHALEERDRAALFLRAKCVLQETRRREGITVAAAQHRAWLESAWSTELLGNASLSAEEGGARARHIAAEAFDRLQIVLKLRVAADADAAHVREVQTDSAQRIQAMARDGIAAAEEAARLRLDQEAASVWDVSVRFRGELGLHAEEQAARRRLEEEAEKAASELQHDTAVIQGRLRAGVEQAEQAERAATVEAWLVGWSACTARAAASCLLLREREQRSAISSAAVASRRALSRWAAALRVAVLEERARRKVAADEHASRVQLHTLQKRHHGTAARLASQRESAERSRRLQLLTERAKSCKDFFIGLTAVERLEKEATFLEVDCIFVEGPCGASGMQLGDVVCKVGGAPVTTLQEMRRALRKTAAIGSAITVAVRRPVFARPRRDDSVPERHVDRTHRVTVKTTDPSFRGAPFFFDTAGAAKLEAQVPLSSPRRRSTVTSLLCKRSDSASPPTAVPLQPLCIPSRTVSPPGPEPSYQAFQEE